MDTATDGHHVLQWGWSDLRMRYWCWRSGPQQSWRNHGLPCRTFPVPGKDLLVKSDCKMTPCSSGEELSDESSFWFDTHNGEEGQGVGADAENQDQHGQWIPAANTEGCHHESCLACTRAGTLPPSPTWNAFSISTETVLFSLKYLMSVWTKSIWKNMIIKARTSKTFGVCNSVQTGFREIGKACLILGLFEHTDSEDVYHSKAYTVGICTHSTFLLHTGHNG